MKKVITIFLMSVVFLLSPQQSEAAHQYIGNVGEYTCYVDTNSIRHFDGWAVYGTVIGVTKFGDKRALEYEITVDTDYHAKTEHWAYSTKGDIHHYRITYNNASGYLRDWFVNVYGWWPKYRQGTPMNPVD